jgi:hypothetical protein
LDSGRSDPLSYKQVPLQQNTPLQSSARQSALDTEPEAKAERVC